MLRAISAVVISGALALALIVGCGGAGLGKEVRPDIEKQMASAEPMIEACYASALQRDRKLRGRMMIRIKTDPKTGRFHRASVASTELADQGLQQCVIETIAALSLDKPTKTSVEADYPIDFAPTE
ncbi:MAG TPA: AgmX/PglI C-terminal domain-containing protein [Kofleriaceae bacterium]|nr:AgmX/PglI C-terminal domain-containing protein [Kofleriaceae bacterium]